jgi:competence protein ComEC
VPFISALGFYHGQFAVQAPQRADHIFNHIKEKTEVIVSGTMATAAEYDGKTSQVVFNSEYIRFRDDPDFLPSTGKILLRLQGEWPAAFVPGDQMVIRTDLRRVESYRTPGSFDYAQHLARKNIWISGFIRSPLFLQKLKDQPDLFNNLLYLPERLRTTIGRHIDASVTDKSRGLYRAILIGDCSRVDEAILETFKGSGTFHILSISGLHMTVIFILLYSSLYWVLNRSERLLFRYPLRKWAAFLCLPVLVFYGLLAGLSTPVFRAVIMSCIVIIAICTDKPKSPSTLLACAALIILTVDPLALFTASFQLSFVATMAIFFLFPALKKLTFPEVTITPLTFRETIINWLQAGILVSTAATLATAPITLYAFNRFSPIGIAANLIIEPLICLWSLPAGFVALPFMFWQPDISAWFLQIGALGLSIAVRATEFFADLPFATLWSPTPSPLLIAVFYSAVICCCLWGKSSKIRLSTSSLIMAVSLLFMLFPRSSLQNKRSESFRLSFLDVGQGSSTLVDFPSGAKILIDGGGASSTTGTVGERIIAPYLWNKGIRGLDTVVITHPDADHYNGLEFIFRRFTPKQLWILDRIGHDENYRQLINLAERLGINVIIPQAGDRWESEDKQDILQCVENFASGSLQSKPEKSPEESNAGIVVKVCSTENCALFPGDISRAKEKMLLGKNYQMKADFLLSPHHGSITSNSPEFLESVSPTWLIVSAGRGGRRFFPHPHLHNDCAQLGITLLTIPQFGTMEAEFLDGQWRIFGYSKAGDNPLLPIQKNLISN